MSIITKKMPLNIVKLFAVFILFLLAFETCAQETFYKYLYHGYSNGRNKSISGAITIGNDTLVALEGVLGHGVNSSNIAHFDFNGTKVNRLPPNDASLIPSFYPHYSSSMPIKIEDGIIACHSYGWKDSLTTTLMVKYDTNHNVAWKTVIPAESIPFFAQGNSEFGLLTRDNKDSIAYYDVNGILQSIYSFKHLYKIKSTFPAPLKINISASSDKGYCWLSNQKDSFQLIAFDKSGLLLLDTVLLNINLKDFVLRNNSIITIEKDSMLHVVFRNKEFNEVNRYSFSNEFPIRYDRLIFKDSLITLVVYNDVDGEVYGTKNIPEIRVIDWNGNYLRRRYLRYNGGYMNITPKNAIGIVIQGIDYTENNGYYMTIFLEGGTLDRQYGLLKTDSNIMANDSIVVPAIRLYLNKWDTLLAPITPDTSTLVSNSLMHSKFTIYPNPTQSSFTILATESSPFSYSLFNAKGQKLISGQGRLNEQIDVSQLLNGLYFLQITIDGIIKNHKILVSN